MNSNKEDFSVIWGYLSKTNRRLIKEIIKAKQDKNEELVALLEDIKKETGFITLDPYDPHAKNNHLY